MQNKLTVIQSVRSWLPQTMPWLYNQVVYLPDSVESQIICRFTANLGQFNVPHVHCATKAGGGWQRRWDAALHRLHVHHHYDLLVQVAEEHNAQLLHSHFGNRGWLDLGGARKADLRQIVTFYGYDVTYLPRQESVWLDRYQELFALIDLVLCEGPFMAESIRKLGCPAHKVKVHHLGVVVDDIPFRPRTWEAGQPLRVLMAASFVEKKGIPYALEALTRVRDEVPLEITIIGDAPDGERAQREKREIFDILDARNLRPITKLLGYQPHDVLMAEAYAHHIFLSPSVTAADGDSEGGAPVSLIEMAASGMPIVSTAHCDIPGIILDGVSGWLAPERDVNALVVQFQRLVDDPDSWAARLRAGRKHIEVNFNAPIQGERLGEIYASVLG